MLSSRASLAFVLAAAVSAAPALALRPHRPATHASLRRTHPGAATSHHAHLAPVSHGRKGHATRRSHVLHGQQAIAPARVTEIQQALIREHYMTGDTSGEWDPATQAAMQKFQADQGWQTRLMPDSRALKKLGLGPDYSDAINASTANFGAPQPASTIPAAQAAGFASAAHVDHEKR
ncbi:MAG TPA: peptidoglycan-binding domain-containing protein [Terracidiphilus sp.]|nr:peptidoglycan-binding domain-containing protein [Terracidiphilus sp.]